MMEKLSAFGVAALWGSAFYHLCVGVLSIVSVKYIRKIGKSLYGLNIPENLDPRHEYTLKPLGIYAMFVGIICVKSALSADIEFQRFVLAMLCFLFIGRSAMRVVHFALLKEAFQIRAKRNAGNIIFNIGLSAAIIYFALI